MPGVDKTQLFFRYDYLDENRLRGEGLVGWYVVKIADPAQAQAMGAKFDTMLPIHRRKPRRRPRKDSSRASRSRSATSARS
jgi:hypothetical protein